jgi:hypothetical protein
MSVISIEDIVYGGIRTWIVKHHLWLPGNLYVDQKIREGLES